MNHKIIYNKRLYFPFFKFNTIYKFFLFPFRCFCGNAYAAKSHSKLSCLFQNPLLKLYKIYKTNSEKKLCVLI